MGKSYIKKELVEDLQNAIANFEKVDISVYVKLFDIFKCFDSVVVKFD